MTPDAPLSQMPGHLIRRLNQHATAHFQQRLRAAGHDITSVQFAALRTLETHADLDQATLAGLIAYDRATIGGVVKRLEQKGLLQRQASPTDKRAFRLSLTAAGAASLVHITPLVAAAQEDILEPLTPEERTAFMALIHKALKLDAK